MLPDQVQQFSYKNNVFQFNVLNHKGHNIWMNFPHSSNKGQSELMTMEKMCFVFFHKIFCFAGFITKNKTK